jgi:hypothetical protein
MEAKFEKVCECCSTVFMAKTTRAKYCSGKCKQRMSVLRQSSRARTNKEVEKIKIPEYFLKRGDICKNLNSGIYSIRG